MIAMRFLNASVLLRKALNHNLSWGFPLGNLLPKTRVLKHRVLERERRPNANASVLGTQRFRTLRSWSIGYPSCSSLASTNLECRKWEFKRWGFKEIRGYLRKKAFFLRFLDFPTALGTLRKRAKNAEKGRFWPISADFQEGRPDTP